jgi:predicted RNase H-like nuclease (RuvC/YqgF family)
MELQTILELHLSKIKENDEYIPLKYKSLAKIKDQYEQILNNYAPIQLSLEQSKNIIDSFNIENNIFQNDEQIEKQVDEAILEKESIIQKKIKVDQEFLEKNEIKNLKSLELKKKNEDLFIISEQMENEVHQLEVNRDNLQKNNNEAMKIELEIENLKKSILDINREVDKNEFNIETIKNTFVSFIIKIEYKIR